MYLEFHSRQAHGDERCRWLNNAWEVPTTYSFRGDLDHMFVDGPSTPPETWNAKMTSTTIRRALFRSCGDKTVERTGEYFDRFVNHMLRAGEKLTDKEFEAWRQNWWQHGCSIKGDSRGQSESSNQLARDCYSLLLWTSCQALAHCFGVLMKLIEIAFLQQKKTPTLDEWEIFRRMNFPQWHLAGLPIWFLGRPQQLFIASDLYTYWINSMSDASTIASGVRILHDLDVYARLVRQRHEADTTVIPSTMSYREGDESRRTAGVSNKPFEDTISLGPLPSAEILRSRGYSESSQSCPGCSKAFTVYYRVEDGECQLLGDCEHCGYRIDE